MEKKITITESQLKQIIYTEIAKFQKKNKLAEEKKRIANRLMEIALEEGETLDEGLMTYLGLKDKPEVVAARKEKLMAQVKKAKDEGWVQKWSVDGEKVSEEEFMKKMEDNGYTGTLVGGPRYKQLGYKSGRYGMSRLGSGGASQGLGI